jgi:toxin YoeB
VSSSRKIVFSAQANDDLLFWGKNKPENVEKINSLLHSILLDPEGGIGKPEPLRFMFSGYWSRRISHKERMIYRWDEKVIEIISLRGHYDS